MTDDNADLIRLHHEVQRADAAAAAHLSILAVLVLVLLGAFLSSWAVSGDPGMTVRSILVSMAAMATVSVLSFILSARRSRRLTRQAEEVIHRRAWRREE